jgi:AbrB family looped-hinge helix DNA binding protein
MTVKVSPKYQVVIPEEIRRALGIKPGMRINVLAKGGIAYLVPEKSLEELQAKLSSLFTNEDSRMLREKKDRKL